MREEILDILRKDVNFVGERKNMSRKGISLVHHLGGLKKAYLPRIGKIKLGHVSGKRLHGKGL